MKLYSLILILTAFIITGCTVKKVERTQRKGGTCHPLVFTTSSTTIDCARIEVENNNLPKDQILFMARAYDQLSSEASQGQGEYLNVLGMLLDCKDSALLANHIHAQYSDIFNLNSTPVTSLKRIHSLAKKNPSLSHYCSRISEI